MIDCFSASSPDLSDTTRRIHPPDFQSRKERGLHPINKAPVPPSGRNSHRQSSNFSLTGCIAFTGHASFEQCPFDSTHDCMRMMGSGRIRGIGDGAVTFPIHTGGGGCKLPEVISVSLGT